MCKACVDEGLMTVEELDEAVLAGDNSVIAISDRIAGGQDPKVILAELEDRERAFALTLAFLLSGLIDPEG